MRGKLLSVNGHCIFVLYMCLGDSSIIHLIDLVNYRNTGFNVLKSYLQTQKSFVPILVLGLLCYISKHLAFIGLYITHAGYMDECRPKAR